MNIWKERVKEVKEMLLSGMTLQQVGDHYGVSRERIRQVNKQYIKLERHEYGESKKVKDRDKEKVSELLSLYGDRYKLHEELAKVIAAKIRRKKQNCKKTQWEFNLDAGDMEFPRCCPILGIELDYFSEKTSPNSPSFYRIDKTKGYVKGNVIVTSQKAIRQHPSSFLPQESDPPPSHSVEPD